MAKTNSLAGLGVPLTETTTYLKVLLYGRQGTGKTSAAAAAAQLGTVLVINAEGGLNARALQALDVPADKILAWPSDGSRITAASLQELHTNLAATLAQDPGSITAIVFDSMTEIHHILRENVTADRVAKSRVMVDPDEIDRRDYNIMTSQLRRLIRLYRDLPTNIIFTALEKLEDSGEIRPAMTPALATDLMGYVDLVGRTAVTHNIHVARFQPTEIINAKDRTNSLPEILANPTIPRLIAATTGNLDIATDTDQIDFVSASSPNTPE